MVDPFNTPAIPFHFWSVVFFTFGSMVGSFLNVCIHRMPLGQSVVTPRSHCPHCGYSIPWFLNLPLFTWLYLRGKCSNCRAPISIRYFLVELLTALTFLTSWLSFGGQSVLLALAYCVVLSGFIVATFIDFEHLIVPDEITLGGIVLGFLCSALVPSLHDTTSAAQALFRSLLGIGVGAGIVYGFLRLGKLMFGRQRFELAQNSRLIFTESTLVFPDREMPYDEIFYRRSDRIEVEASHVELPDRCYKNVSVQLYKHELRIGEDTFDPEAVAQMEIVTDHLVLPREAMGLGDVKFMAAIGAFLGWKATLFSFMASSVIGSVFGIAMIALRRHEWSSRIGFCPYIAAAATLWIFGGKDFVAAWFAR